MGHVGHVRQATPIGGLAVRWNILRQRFLHLYAPLGPLWQMSTIMGILGLMNATSKYELRRFPERARDFIERRFSEVEST